MIKWLHSDYWPLLALIPVIYGVVIAYKMKSESDEKKKDYKRMLLPTITAIVLALLTANNSFVENKEKGLKSDTISQMVVKIDSIQKLSKATKDTLSKIGITVNDSTGKIIDIDKKILQILIDKLGSAIPDSTNFAFKISKEFIYVWPKQGTWGKFFIAMDSEYVKGDKEAVILYHYDTFLDTTNIFKVGKKTYTTYIFWITTGITKDNPAVIKFKSQNNQKVFFGDDLFKNKRYEYKNGVVSWIPTR